MTPFYLLANCDHTRVHLGRNIQKKCSENTKVNGCIIFPDSSPSQWRQRNIEIIEKTDLVAKENNLFKVMTRCVGLTFQTQT